MKRNECHRWLRAARALAAACVLASPAIAASAETEANDAAVREQFRAAYAAAAVGIDAAADDEALRAYVLYPYLRAARLERRARACARCMARNGRCGRRISSRRPASAGRASSSPRLAREPRAPRVVGSVSRRNTPSRVATPELECQRFNARIARGRDRWALRRDPRAMAVGLSLAERVRARVPMARERRASCRPSSSRSAWSCCSTTAKRRSRVSSRRGFQPKPRCRCSSARSSSRAPRACSTRSSAIRAESVPRAVVLEAWSRLARNAPEEALARYRALFERMPAREDAHELAQPLAKGLAWDRRPEALDYFARVPSATLDAVGREWRARAAMWCRGLGRSPRGDRRDAPGRTGRLALALLGGARGRAAKARRTRRARSITAALAGDNYYSAMAAARLGERVVPRLEPIPLDAAQIETIAAVDAFRRVRELVLVGLRELATNEWHYGYALLPEHAAAPSDSSRCTLGDPRRCRRDGDEPRPFQRLHACSIRGPTRTRSRQP